MKKQLGLSLIEVMVSVLILAFGLLGLAGLQTRAVIMNQSSYYRSIAADIGAELGDRIRANRTPFLVSVDATPVDLPPDFSKCSQVSGNLDSINCLAQDTGRATYNVVNDMTEWNTFLRSQLPGATFTLVSQAGQSAGFYRYTLTINWTDNRSTTNSGEITSSYTTVIE